MPPPQVGARPHEPEAAALLRVRERVQIPGRLRPPGVGVPLSATVTVSVLGAKNKQGIALSTDPRAIAESLRTITARREGDAWRKVTTVGIPEVGPAARTYGVEDVPVAPGDSRTLRMVLTQTYIPVPGTTDQVVLVSGASPVLDLTEAFHDIFDAVTGTFRFV
nr:hypothetical protein [Streptomyces sp. NRRL F-5650]